VDVFQFTNLIPSYKCREYILSVHASQSTPQMLSVNHQGVTVVGSVRVLLAAIDTENINESTADEWLSTWINEIGYYVPY